MEKKKFYSPPWRGLGFPPTSPRRASFAHKFPQKNSIPKKKKGRKNEKIFFGVAPKKKK